MVHIVYVAQSTEKEHNEASSPGPGRPGEEASWRILETTQGILKPSCLGSKPTESEGVCVCSGFFFGHTIRMIVISCAKSTLKCFLRSI